MRHRPLLPVFAVWLFVMQLLNGAGVAVTKEQRFHADSSARPFVFDTVRDYGPFVIFETGTRAISIDRVKFLEYIEVSRLPKELLTDDQVAPSRASLKKIKAFTQRFPHSEPLLREQLAALQMLVDNYDAGNVLTGNRWLAKTEYIEQQRLQVEAAAQAERQRKAKFEEEARIRKEQAEQEKPLAEAQIREASMEDALFRIYKKSGNGVLVEILTSPAEDPPVVVLVEDGNTRPLQENVSYQGNLYYSGNYPCEGTESGVRAYCLDRPSAVFKLSFRLSLPYAVKAIASTRSWERRPGSSYSAYKAGNMVWVDGYFRQDGTWVSGHYRSAPTAPTPFYSASSDSSDSSDSSTRQKSSGYSTAPSTGSDGTVHVNGYFRKNGTYVHSYTRRK